MLLEGLSNSLQAPITIRIHMQELQAPIKIRLYMQDSSFVSFSKSFDVLWTCARVSKFISLMTQCVPIEKIRRTEQNLKTNKVKTIID